MTPVRDDREKTAADFTLFAALFGSAFVGLEIVASDSWLWAVAPTHAYGLVAFVGIDVAMVVLLWRGVPHAGTLTALLAAAQLVAMGGDLAGLSPPPGIPASGFASYLLSDVPFVVLLWLQPAIAYLGGLVQVERSRAPPTLVS
jgi:hypothetical protein